MNFRISASITDFPLQTSVATFFQEFKKAGVDSVELVIGAKTIHIPTMFRLSQKYDLPITSLHQSYWSGLGFASDEYFIREAKKYGITTFTFHPLTFLSFADERMKRYFRQLQQLQKQYSVTICLENMPKEKVYEKLFYPPYASMDSQLEKMYEIAKNYDLSLTYDMSHTKFVKPQDHAIFVKMLPRIKNIHVSSFNQKNEHLSLDTGDVDASSFFTFLKQKNYKGLLTFEINYSLKKRIFAPYDFSEIRRSVALIRSL